MADQDGDEVSASEIRTRSQPPERTFDVSLEQDDISAHEQINNVMNGVGRWGWNAPQVVLLDERPDVVADFVAVEAKDEVLGRCVGSGSSVAWVFGRKAST